MTSVLTELSRWATGLGYWEQAALDKIVAGVQFADADYDELLHYLLEEAKLVEPAGPRPALRFPKDAGAAAQPSAPARLVSISNLQNVNALVPGQTLTFSPAMTAVYGGNGSGKSGYARVLGCAGFTRGDREVLPDVTRPAAAAPLMADIEITDGSSNRSIRYQIGGQCPDLVSFYVFDSTSVRVHLTGSNSLSFSPAGLSYLTRLVEVTDEVRRRLRARVEECSQPHCFGAWFQGDSEVSRLIASLGPATDLKALRAWAILSPDEQARIKDLDNQIARLKTEDVSQEIAALKQQGDDLETLADSLHAAQAGLGEAAVTEVRAAVQACLDRQAEAQRAGLDQFKSEDFTQTGSEAWQRFVEAARSLAEAEGTAARPYPQAESHCLLCRQPLSAEARDLLLRLWAFLEGEAQHRLEEALALVQQKQEALDAIPLDFFDDQSVSYRTLQTHDPALGEKVTDFVATCRRRREALQQAMEAGAVGNTLPALPDSSIPEIEAIVASLGTRLGELERKNPAAEIADLERSLCELRHRALLVEHLPEIEGYVQKRIWAQQAAKAGGTTHRITAKHNELFKQLVTDRYVELFRQMLRDLGRPLKVKVDTQGRKGKTYKQIVVQADPSAPAGGAAVDKVLSEGEKRAVALADFLTEVALDTASSGVILDDPVTSLDLEWKELVAQILAAEASHRQVIVFTHDLPFLYHVKKHCEHRKVEIASHWIRRGDHDDQPGYVFLNNSPALERDYRNATQAREMHKKAKGAAAAEQETLLREGFGSLRTTYEAFIIFDLLNEVVMRFDERISVGRLRNVVWDQSVANEAIAKHELLSRHIEGHLHSDALGAQKPTPETLMREIEDFEALKKRLKELKKAAMVA